ncbi:MAG: pseudouridine synthase, partial [bacterium]
MTFDPSDDSPRKKSAQDAKPWLRKADPESASTSTETHVERPGERIAKALARAGLCSRREAERWIEEGRITVNGVVLESPAFNVTAQDRIAVDGRPVDSPEPTRLWRYHKPDGLVTTHKDPQGREPVFDHLPEDLPRVISVGRLDLSSEGLLLLTNDGGLARSLELPSTGWLRRYRVRAFGRVSQEELAQLADGITVDGITYGPMEAILDR